MPDINPHIVTLIATVCGSAVTASGAWIVAKLARKVVLKVGDIEVQAHTMEEAKMLLRMASRVRR